MREYYDFHFANSEWLCIRQVDRTWSIAASRRIDFAREWTGRRVRWHLTRAVPCHCARMILQEMHSRRCDIITETAYKITLSVHTYEDACWHISRMSTFRVISALCNISIKKKVGKGKFYRDNIFSRYDRENNARVYVCMSKSN